MTGSTQAAVKFHVHESLLGWFDVSDHPGDRIPANDISIKIGTVLGRAFLGGEVHLEQTESLGEAVAPFEVVEQGPGKVAAQGHAVVNGGPGGSQVVPQVVRAGARRRFVRSLRAGR